MNTKIAMNNIDNNQTNGKKSTMYDLMRRSEMMDDDGMDIEEAQATDARSGAAKFKEQYKSFYTDIKTDISEDW